MISVLILTAGRAEFLARCLDGLAAGTRTPDEILVLLTREDDATAALLKGRGDAGLRWLLREGSGSYAEARNHIAREASGAKIAFIDDDCVPAPDWLARADAALERLDAVGGIVAPGGPLKFPPWWHPDMSWMCGLSTPGMQGRFAGSICYPQTANLALRRAVLEREPFQEVGGALASGPADYATGREDAELWRRLRRNGYAVAVDPDWIVHHHIPQERLAWEALLSRARHDGEALARREMNAAAMRQAWRDVAYAPLALARNWLRWPLPYNPPLALDRLWTARQKALLATWKEKAGAREMQTFEAARKEARRHVVLSEIKRPMGRLRVALHRVRREAGGTHRGRAGGVLFVLAGYMGDLALSLPAMQALRRGSPWLTIDFASPDASGVDFMRQSGLVQKALWIHPRGEGGGRRLDRVIAGGEYRAVVAPYFHPKAYGRAAHLLGNPATRTILFEEDNGLIRWSDGARATVRVPRDPGRNEILSLADLFANAGRMAPLEPWDFQYGDEEADRTRELIRSLNPEGGRLVALHPGAGRKEKEWVWERWFELAGRLEVRGARCVFLGSAPLMDRVRTSLKGANLKAAALDPMPLRTLALFLRGCDLAISPDSGPRHLACAVGASTVGLFGPTDERRWGPLWDRERHAIVRAAAWDLTPEERDGLPENHQCALIEAERVVEAAAGLLGLPV